MAKTKKTKGLHRKLTAWLVGGLAVGWLALQIQQASAASLTSSSLALADPRPSATNVTYTFTGSNVTLSLVKCIKIVYSDAASGGATPASLTTTGAAVAIDTVNTNYIPTPGGWALNKATNGTLLLTNAGGETPANAASRKIAVSGITNGSVADTKYFARINTYNNTDCTSSPVDSTTAGFLYTNGSTVTLTVDPTLSFTVNAVPGGQACNGGTSTAASTSTTIPFGTVNTASNAVVCQDLQSATNSNNGFTVFIRYTGKPTNSLGDQIADIPATNGAPTTFSVPGTEAYGYTTDDATLQAASAARFISNKWAAASTTNAEVAYSPTGVSALTTRVGHQTGVSSLTRPGTYTTTVIYTCTPVF